MSVLKEQKRQQPSRLHARQPWEKYLWGNQEGHAQRWDRLPRRDGWWQWYMSPTCSPYERGAISLWCRYLCTCACALEREERAHSPASLGCGRVFKMLTVLHSRHGREKACWAVGSPVHYRHARRCICVHIPGCLGQICVNLLISPYVPSGMFTIYNQLFHFPFLSFPLFLFLTSL